MTPESKDELTSRFARYSKYRNQFKKAIDAAYGGFVKKHLFTPSGRSIYTVVGRTGDEFLDPEKTFCSCQSYFYKVLSGEAEYCYHIISYKIAEEAKLIDEIVFNDEEYDGFLKSLVLDLLNE